MGKSKSGMYGVEVWVDEMQASLESDVAQVLLRHDDLLLVARALYRDRLHTSPRMEPRPWSDAEIKALGRVRALLVRP